jgi:hypothetical protein
MIGDIGMKTNLYIICGYTDMRRHKGDAPYRARWHVPAE